jgi:hypothetical protein
MPSKVERDVCIRINSPEWFKRADFIKYLRDAHTATWHDKASDTPTETSDVFFTYDADEGSDAEDMPEDIWREVSQICQSEGVEFAIVWVTPID